MPAAVTAHPAAPHNLPVFITEPGQTDVLFVGMAVFLTLAVLGVGLIFLRLHTLPERMAHKSQKLQFEIVAVLGLLALFTHQHIFWVAGLILALIDLPDFASPLGRIARGIEKLAGIETPPEVVEQEKGLSFGHHGHEDAAVAPAPVPASTLHEVHAPAPRPVHGA